MPRGVVFHGSPGLGLLLDRWLDGLVAKGIRWMILLFSGVFGGGSMVVGAGEITFGLLGRESRYFSAYTIMSYTFKVFMVIRTLSQMSCLSLVSAVIFISRCGVEMITLYWNKPGGMGLGSSTDRTPSMYAVMMIEHK